MKAGRNIVAFRGNPGFPLLVVLALATGCAARQLDQFETTASIETRDYAVEVTQDKALRTKIEIPIPPNPYDDGCMCVCEAACAMHADAPELEALLEKLTHKATFRAEIAAKAVLESGHELLEHEEWKDVVTDSMELLGNPTLVLVPLPGGSVKKVSLEKVGELGVSPTLLVTIRSSVGGKMQAALKASMISHGVPAKKAQRLSGQIIKTYMKEILAKSG